MKKLTLLDISRRAGERFFFVRDLEQHSTINIYMISCRDDSSCCVNTVSGRITYFNDKDTLVEEEIKLVNN